MIPVLFSVMESGYIKHLKAFERQRIVCWKSRYYTIIKELSDVKFYERKVGKFMQSYDEEYFRGNQIKGRELPGSCL